LDKDEAMGWQETRLWCFLCGKRHLRGIIEHTHAGGTAMRLRCPQCSPRYQSDVITTAHIPGSFGPLRSFRPALKRVWQVGAAFYQTCLIEHHCPTCHSPVQSQIIDRKTLALRSSLYDALPLGIYARVDCPSCGIFFCEACYPALH